MNLSTADRFSLRVGDYLFVSKYSYGYSRYSFPFSPPLFSGRIFGSEPKRGEIAVFKPYDPQGYTPNAPFVMNAMPWKGHVLFSDFNSGLWAAKLEPKPAVVQ